MPDRSPESQACVEAAIEFDQACAAAAELLLAAPDDHMQHAGRRLARAYQQLDTAAALQDAAGNGKAEPVAPPALRPLGEKADQVPAPRAWTSDEDRAWLQKHMRGDCVEVGTAAGASAAAMIHAHRLTCVDPWPEPGDGAHPDWPSRFDEFTQNLARMPHRARIDVLRAPSLAAANAFESESLDSVFLDGDHSDAAVAADIAAWLPKLKPGGLLCGHDYGHPDFPGVRAAVDARFVDAVRTHGTIWYYRTPSLFAPELK